MATAAPPLVVATRLHWRNHKRDAPIDGAALLAQVLALCSRAASYCGTAGVAIAIGVPDEASPTLSEPRSAFGLSVVEFLQQLRAATEAGVAAADGRRVPVQVVSMLHWGKFVPALNALVSTAATEFPTASMLLLQSLEVEADADALDFLISHFDQRRDLVIGAALPGHAFSPSRDGQPLELTGTSTPWNTLAVWNLRQLSKVGFPLIGDGFHVDGECAGVEEVSTIATYQQLFQERGTKATVLRVPGIAWQVDEFDDPKRREWQASKMASKNQRAAKQMERLGIPSGHVYHVDRTSC